MTWSTQTRSLWHMTSVTKGAFTLNSRFGPKALSSVGFRWCESINRTKSSGPRPPNRGSLGPLDSTPDADLPEDEGTSIGPILICLQVWTWTTPQPVCYIVTPLLPGADQIIELVVWKCPYCRCTTTIIMVANELIMANVLANHCLPSNSADREQH